MPLMINSVDYRKNKQLALELLKTHQHGEKLKEDVIKFIKYLQNLMDLDKSDYIGFAELISKNVFYQIILGAVIGSSGCFTLSKARKMNDTRSAANVFNSLKNHPELGQFARMMSSVKVRRIMEQNKDIALSKSSLKDLTIFLYGINPSKYTFSDTLEADWKPTRKAQYGDNKLILPFYQLDISIERYYGKLPQLYVVYGTLEKLAKDRDHISEDELTISDCGTVGKMLSCALDIAFKAAEDWIAQYKYPDNIRRLMAERVKSYGKISNFKF